MLNLVKGDLFESNADIIAHGCNCKGGFGSGVAYTMAKRYPKAKWYYLDKFEEDGWNLGDVQFVLQFDGKYVANCATQDNYLPRGVQHADYDAIRKTMTTVKEFAKGRGLSIAIPKIGAGLAGGSWTVIEGILLDVFVDYDATVYYLEP